METCTVPIGNEAVNVWTYSPERIGELRYIRSDCTFVKPGATFIAPVDGYPIIIATVAGLGMIIGHAKSTSVVDEIVRMFQKHGATVGDIVMCAQFATPDLGSEFIDRALKVGLGQPWAANLIERTEDGGRSYEYVAIRRQGCYH